MGDIKEEDIPRLLVEARKDGSLQVGKAPPLRFRSDGGLAGVTEVGCYPLNYLAGHEVFCPECALVELEEAILNWVRGWRGRDITRILGIREEVIWEGAFTCDACSRHLSVAYPDEE